MYPEPGLRDTFVTSSRPMKSMKPMKYGSQSTGNLQQTIDFEKSQRSRRVMRPGEINRVATEYADGRAPSYGRILGLSQRLD